MSNVTFYACNRPVCPVCSKIVRALTASGHKVEVVRYTYVTPTRIELLCDGIVYDDIVSILDEFCGGVEFSELERLVEPKLRFLDATDEGLPELD